MAAIIGGASNAQKASSDRLESYSASNARSWGPRQGIAQSQPWDPVMNAPELEVTNGTGGWTQFFYAEFL
jgi:hypothetical protein